MYGISLVRRDEERVHALAAVLNIMRAVREILGFQMIMLVVGFLILFFKWRYTRSDGDVLVLVIWFRLDALCVEKVEDGATERIDRYFIWNLDEDVFFPLASVDKVAKREWYVGFKVGSVLSEDNVSPSFIEVPGCHGENQVLKPGS